MPQPLLGNDPVSRHERNSSTATISLQQWSVFSYTIRAEIYFISVISHFNIIRPYTFVFVLPNQTPVS
jgi:hypothetical protein